MQSMERNCSNECGWNEELVIESLVRSGYLPFLVLTETLTGYTKSQISRKLDLTDTNQSGAVFLS